jgi:uncharacterized Zn finger protein (UPF0148 family)
MRCPFCGETCDDGVLVCPTCARDVAIPAHLQKEHDELRNRRDALRAELERITTELAHPHRRRLPGRPAS